MNTLNRFIISPLLFALLIASTLNSQSLNSIKLPQPQKEIGQPIMKALGSRQSSRNIDSKQLPLQEISNILWAGFGINRSVAGKRTAPSAHNWQEIEIYVVLEHGVYLYNAKENILSLVIKGDFRSVGTTQPFVKTAPLNLIYVADLMKLPNPFEVDEESKLLYTIDAGFIAQNVNLYCASQNLGVVVRGSIDRNIIAETFNLRSEQKVIIAQTIGYITD